MFYRACLNRNLVLGLLLMFGLANLFGQKPKDDFPPKPKWRPNIPVDLNVVADRITYYTDHKRTVVIFRNGTCVILATESIDPESDAKAGLNKVYNYHPDFKTQKMDDGNYSVSFSQPNCMAIVTQLEFEKNKDYISKNHLDGLVRDEVLLNAEKQPNVFDERGKIGLFGRARMFLDAENPVVVKVIKAGTNG